MHGSLRFRNASCYVSRHNVRRNALPLHQILKSQISNPFPPSSYSSVERGHPARDHRASHPANHSIPPAHHRLTIAKWASRSECGFRFSLLVQNPRSRSANPGAPRPNGTRACLASYVLRGRIDLGRLGLSLAPYTCFATAIILRNFVAAQGVLHGTISKCSRTGLTSWRSRSAPAHEGVSQPRLWFLQPTNSTEQASLEVFFVPRWTRQPQAQRRNSAAKLCAS